MSPSATRNPGADRPAEPDQSAVLVGGLHGAHNAAVTPDEFREATLAIVRSGTPSADANLLGMQIDFDLVLAGLEQIDADSVVVECTPQAERLIRGSCKPAIGVSPAAAIEAVRRAWLATLRYNYTEAHCTVLAERSATLEFVTQIGPGAIYVTGRVDVLARD